MDNKNIDKTAKKSLLGRLFDKLDKVMKEKADKPCCCGSQDKGKKSCCS